MVTDIENHLQVNMLTTALVDSSLFIVIYLQAIQIHRVTLMESENHISGKYMCDIK